MNPKEKKTPSGEPTEPGISRKAKAADFFLAFLHRVLALIPLFTTAVIIILSGINTQIGKQFDIRFAEYEESFNLRLYSIEDVNRLRAIHEIEKQFLKISNPNDKMDIKPNDLTWAILLYSKLPKSDQEGILADQVSAIRDYYIVALAGAGG